MGKHKRKNKDEEISVDVLYRQIKRLKKSLKAKKNHQNHGEEKAEEVINLEQEETAEQIALEQIDLPIENTGTVLEQDDPPNQTEEQTDELLNEVLGQDPTKTNQFGATIHSDIATRWGHIVKEGIHKETKIELQKKSLIPENCQFLEAPILNPEIKAAISEPVYKRDRVLIAQQNLLGQATASLGLALNSMLNDTNRNLEITKTISNSGRMLCDLFHTQSCARRSLIQFALNKDTKDIVAQTKIEKHLFGDNLSEALKAGKAIHKTGSEIRYSKPPPEKTNPKHNSTLNFRGPPRKQGQRPPEPSAGRSTYPKQASRHVPQRTPVQKAAPPYKHRK